MMTKLAAAAFFVTLTVLTATAQVGTDQKCSGRIYSQREVTKPARLTGGPDLKVAVGMAGPSVRGKVVLEAVLCRSGRVTDVRIIEGLSPTINEFVVAAMSTVRFVPAELRWHSVSQRIRFELGFGPNAPGVRLVTSSDAAGRLVENVEIVGNRILTTKQILSWIRTRPGDPYSEGQIKQDFDAVLATGHFDKTQTRVTIEDAVRGGVAVIFEVVELPVIAEVKFEGLKVEPSIILDALKKEKIHLQAGKPFDVRALNSAVRVIKQALVASGHGEGQVETKIETIDAMTVKLTFVITRN